VSTYLFDWRRKFCREAPARLATRSVGLALSMYADNHTGLAHPSQSRLAKDLGCHPDTVGEHLRTLAELGWIERERGQRGYEYTLKLPDSDESRVGREPTPKKADSDESRVGPRREPGRTPNKPESDESRVGSERGPSRSSVGSDPEESRVHVNSQELTRNSQAGSEPARDPAQSSGPEVDPALDPSPAEEVRALLEHHGFDVNLSAAEDLCAQIADLGLDPVREVGRRESDGVYDRIDNWSFLRSALIEDAEKEAKRQAKRRVGRNNHERQWDEPEIPEGDPTSGDETTGACRWPPAEYDGHPDRWLEVLDQLEGQISEYTLDDLRDVCVHDPGDRLILVCKDESVAEMTVRPQAELIGDAAECPVKVQVYRPEEAGEVAS